MLQYDFEESLGYWVTTSAHAFHRAMNEALAPHGITFRQAQILACLACYGDMTQTELAGKLMVEPPTLVGILDRLERNQWIRRDDFPGDRRKKIVRPNPEAEAVWEKIVACAKQVRSRAVEGLSPRQLQTLKRVLEQVRSNLEDADVDTRSAIKRNGSVSKRRVTESVA